jgi:hypothetical protein
VTDRSHWKVRKYKLGEEPEVDEDTIAMTHGERIELAWLLTFEQWAMYDPDALRGGFRRDIERIVRRQG